MTDQIGYWMGNPISEMSREELLDVIQAMGRMDQQKDADHDRYIALLEEIADRQAPPTFMQLFLRRVMG